MKGKRRGPELLKSLLILLLSASAVCLLLQTPLVEDSGVLELLSPSPTRSGAHTEVTLTAAAHPSRMAVSSGGERYGIQYDQSETDELFTRLGPLLGEALTSSGEAKEIAETIWRRYLQGSGIYFDFTGEIPLSALSGWLQPDGLCALTATARRILLADGSGDTVLLCYQDSENNRFYACETGLTWSLHMETAIGSVTGNDAQFAFEHESWTELLDPYTLITEENTRWIYLASTPSLTGSELSDLLDVLDYTGRNHASVSGGELYLDGNDRLHLLDGGKVSYTAAQPGKYPVATARGRATVAEAIEAARQLAESTIGKRSGEAELYLISVGQLEDGYQIRFGYRLDGSTVWLYNEGWAAEFYVREDYISEFTLNFRTYLSTGENATLLSMDWTVSMISDLTDKPCELILQYRDQGESQVEPVWAAK